MNKFFKLITILIFCSFTSFMHAIPPDQVATAAIKQKKLKCFLYGNCVMETFCTYLREKYPDKYELTFVLNWASILNNTPIPVDKLNEADIFIYSPLNGHGELDTDYLKQNYVKQGCQCISFPYVYFSGYFPDYVQDPNNPKTSTPEFPFGMYGYGHMKIIDLISLGMPPKKIVKKAMSINFYSPQEVNDNLKETLSILREKELETDVRLSNFIKKNYKKYRLFHVVNHPSNMVLKKLFKQLLRLLGHSTAKLDTDPFFDYERMVFGSTDIIYPSVANALKLEFEITDPIRCRQQVSLIQFIDEYVKFLYPEYYNSFMPQ